MRRFVVAWGRGGKAGVRARIDCNVVFGCRLGWSVGSSFSCCLESKKASEARRQLLSSGHRIRWLDDDEGRVCSRFVLLARSDASSSFAFFLSTHLLFFSVFSIPSSSTFSWSGSMVVGVFTPCIIACLHE